MPKHPSEVVREVLVKGPWYEKPDGTIVHPYEEKLKNSPLEQKRRNLRLAGRPRR